MPITASTITFAQAKARVAAAAGATSTDELTRAGYAVQAAFQDWNNEQAWPFTLLTGSDIAVISGTASYTLPAAIKQIYDVRLTGTNRTLFAMDRRHYDYVTWSQTSQGTPQWYSLLLMGIAGGRQITLLPTPGAGDTLSIRYYRDLSIPSADGDILDIPADYENYVLALAKYLYLLDKGGPPERLTGWQQFAEAGKKKAIASEVRLPDMEKMFIPGSGVKLSDASTLPPESFYDGW